MLLSRDDVCQEDWVDIYNVYSNRETKVGRYCGFTSPGPIESMRASLGLKLAFRSNEKDVYSGFKARYSFEATKSIFGGKCFAKKKKKKKGIFCSTSQNDVACYFSLTM